MNDLHELRCVPCRGDEPPMDRAKAEELHTRIPEWELDDSSGELKLIRKFKFRNFKEALDFTNKIGQIAEEEDHHPAILTEWGQVTVSWWTHKIHGLHQNDFIMAARTDRLYPDRQEK